jgi:hypothetical protein
MTCFKWQFSFLLCSIDSLLRFQIPKIDLEPTETGLSAPIKVDEDICQKDLELLVAGYVPDGTSIWFVNVPDVYRYRTIEMQSPTSDILSFFL